MMFAPKSQWRGVYLNSFVMPVFILAIGIEALRGERRQSSRWHPVPARREGDVIRWLWDFHGRAGTHRS
jgi:hypothetical protein